MSPKKTKDERLKDIADKFRSDMEKLGLGVTLHVPGMDPVKVTDPPEVKPKEKP